MSFKKTHTVTYQEGLNPAKYINPSEVENLLKKMRQREFLLRQTDVNPRVFNLWKKIGLVEIPYSPIGREWIKLNFVDYLWLKIILDLRKFGCSLENIIEVKKVCLKEFCSELTDQYTGEDLIELLLNSVFPTVNASNQKSRNELKLTLETHNISDLLNAALGKPMTMLEMVIVNMITTGSSAKIVITPLENITNEKTSTGNEVAVPTTDNKKSKRSLAAFLFTDEINKMLIPENVSERWIFELSHICLPLRNYLRDFVMKDENEKYILKLELLSQDELRLLKEIRKGRAHEIKITLKNGTVKRLEVKTNLEKSEESRLIETFGKNEYTEISYSTEKGKIVRFEKTTKIMF